MRGPRTLRTRVAVLVAVAMLVLLTLAGAGLVLVHRALLVEGVDEAVVRQADALVHAVEAGRHPTAADLASDDVVVQVLGSDGSIRTSLPPSAPPLLGDERAPADDRVRSVMLAGDGEARLTARRADDGTVIVAGSLDDVAESTAALVGILAFGVPVSAVALAVLIWWAVGRALLPVEQLRAQVDRITASRLDEEVDEPTGAAEIARLARTMNAMLTRLQLSAEQQRRFVADAAHELRSPLARMRAELEVDAAHPGSADPAATASSALAETVGLQRLIDDLLLLARGDAGVTGRSAPVDLDDVVARAVRSRRDARVVVPDLTPVQVLGDVDQLERLVANLLDNAVRHARERIVVGLAAGDDAAELTVADDGPGIPAADADRVFERFTRLDDARTRDEGGVGLGLAIARDIAERHGGSLTVGIGPGRGAQMLLRLPVARLADGRISRSGAG
jgi:signal transduction histidine kinase